MNSCTGDPHGEPHLHALVDAAGAKRQDEKEHERTLFLDAVAAARNLDLENLVPNLHRREENRRSPTHPRAHRSPEAEENGDLAGGSTRCPHFASLNRSGKRVPELPANGRGKQRVSRKQAACGLC